MLKDEYKVYEEKMKKRLARPADAGHYPLGCQHSEGY